MEIGNLPIYRPGLWERLDQIRPILRKVIIHLPTATNLRSPSLRSSLQREQRNNVSRISMENLLIGCICWRSDSLCRMGTRKVGDMSEDAVVSILEAAVRAYVWWDTGVDEDVIFAWVGSDWDASEDGEATACV